MARHSSLLVVLLSMSSLDDATLFFNRIVVFDVITTEQMHFLLLCLGFSRIMLEEEMPEEIAYLLN